ncbi:MAG: DNA polymerase I [Clostridiales bacterium]|nr:DNA polymerase I [Clostridiales bacterium]
MEKPRMIVIDGNSLINRAFYALPPLSTKQGLPTNAVYGFVTMLFKILEEYNPDYISVAFDRKEATFRHNEYSDYKAQRKGMPEDLAVQVPVLKDLLDAMDINRMEAAGFEADDVIGTLSRYGEQEGMEVLIVTGDRDALQLVSDSVKVIYTKRGVSDFELCDKRSVKERYGLEPAGLIDLKGLMGDKSDNIPGVPGVGEKTALKLLQQYGNLEAVLENANNMPEGRLKQSLISNIQQAVLSKKLATICRDIPIVLDIGRSRKPSPDIHRVAAKLSELEFNSLIDRAKDLLGTGDTAKTPGNKTPECTYTCLETLDGMDAVLENIQRNKCMAFEIVTSTDDDIEFEVYGISIAWDRGEGVYIPTGNEGCALDEAAVFNALKPIMEDGSIKKLGHHLKQDIIALAKRGISLVNYTFDSEIFAYLLDPAASSYDLEKIAIKYLGENIAGIEEIAGKGKDRIRFNQIEMEKICRYLADRARCMFALRDVLEKQIRDAGMEDLVYSVELPLVQVLASMQLTGIRLDRKELEQYLGKLGRNIEALTLEIYSHAGEEFNINSTKQLGEVLFVKLGLPPVKKTKTGYSTDVEVLEQLRDRHPIVEKVLEYRQLIKLKSTYAEGLMKAINPRTGRVHSNFKQTVTTTGRISSTEPNLQNIPIKLDLGREIRRAFIPGSEEYLFVAADYSQIELRVLAHVSGDKNLIKAFREQQDIHSRTAAQVFDVTPLEVTPAMRNSAKAVNFGIIYGISDFGLARSLHIPRSKAAGYIKRYFEVFSGVREYMDRVIKEGTRQGMVRTMLGRTRYLPELKSGNRNIRNLGERLAMNTPIQGSAADIIKLAMNKVYNRLKEENLRSRLVLQVHDELIIETHRDELDRVKAILRECMEGAVDLKVPLEVKMSVGRNWYEA